MIAVDPHKASNTAAVLDPVTKTLIESARFANTSSSEVAGQVAAPPGFPASHRRWLRSAVCPARIGGRCAAAAVRHRLTCVA